MVRKKVGLALGSGAARGLAHIGVLSVLEKAGVPIDLIAGTSMGAIIGAFYAAGKSISEIKQAVANLNQRQMLSPADLALSPKGLIKGQKVTEWLKSVLGDWDFQDLKIPFACIATDITNCDEVVIRDGPVAEAVRASACLPVIFTPTKWRGRYLVDGALVNPIPVRVLREMGADLVIAVNVVPFIGDKLRKEAGEMEKPKEPNMLNVLMRVIYTLGYQAASSGIREADVTIAPDVACIRPDGFTRVRECVRRGEQAAEAAIPEIESLL